MFLTFVVLITSVYALACWGLGRGLLRWLAGAVDLPFADRTASAFLLGMGVLANVWIAAGLPGLLQMPIVWGVLILSLAGLLPGWRAESHAAGKAMRDLGASWWSENLAFKLIALLNLALIGTSLVHTLVAPLPCQDAAAFYMVLPKLVAAEGRLELLPGTYEYFCQVGLIGEMHWAALMELGLTEEVKAFAWPIALAGAIMLLALGRRCGVQRRGQSVCLAMLFTSLTFTAYVWDGKVDLFGTALGLAAYYWACRAPEPAAFRLTGVFAALAIVAKASLVIPLAPGILAILAWNSFTSPEHERRFGPLARQLGRSMLVTTIFGLLVALPHVIKNVVLLDEPFAPWLLLHSPNTLVNNAWYRPEVTRYIVATYPFALVFGRYPGMGGGLSPLVIMFLPLALLLPRPMDWRRSGLVQISVVGLIGTAAWVIIEPSMIAPRYILPPLLLLLLPAARAVEHLCWRQPSEEGVGAVPLAPLEWRSLGWAALAGLVIVQGVCLHYAKVTDLVFQQAKLYLRTGANPLDHPCRRSCEALNSMAAPNERVLLASYYRYWLRPDLLKHADRAEEKVYADPATRLDRLWQFPNALARWEYLRRQGFAYLLIDTNSHARYLELLGIDGEGRVAELPAGLSVELIYHEGKYFALALHEQSRI